MRGNGLHTSKAFLRRRYVQESRTLKEIAAECDVSIQTISTQLKKFGLK